MVGLLLRRGVCHRRLALSSLQPRTLTSSLSLALVMTGILCAASTLSIYFAVKHISPSEVSQYHYNQLLARAFVVYLVWYDKSVLPLLASGSLILCSDLLITLAARNSELALCPTSPVDKAYARCSSCQSATPLARLDRRFSGLIPRRMA